MMFVRILLLLPFFLLFPHHLHSQRPLRWEPEVIRYTSKNGLPSSMVFKVLEDRRGYIWLATNHGAVRYDGHDFQTYTTRDGLMDNTILNIIEDQEGRLWFMSLSKKLCYFHNERIFPFAANRLLEDRLFLHSLDLYFEDDGSMWLIAPSGFSISRYRNGTLEKVAWKADLRTQDANYLCRRVGSRWLTYTSAEPSRENRLLLKGKDQYVLKLVQTVGGDESYRCLQLPNGALIAANKYRLVTFDTVGLGRVVHQPPDEYLGNGPTVDSKGDLWMSTKSGAYRFRGGDFDNAPPEHFLPGIMLTGILRDRTGNYWFSSWDEGLLCMPGIQFHSLRLSSTRKENIISGIKVYDDRIWILTSHSKLFVLDDNANPELVIDGERLLAPTSESIGFMRDTKGRFLFGQRLHAFTRSADGYRKQAVSPGSSSKAMVQLRDGRIVVGTSHGIHVYSEDLINLTPPGPKPYAYDERTNAVCEDADGSVWLGTGSGLYRFDGSTTRSYAKVDPLLGNRIISIARMSNGNLLLGTWGTGLLIKEGDRVHQIDADSGLASDITRSIYAENDTSIWVGTNKGLSRVTILDDAPLRYNIENYTTAKGLPSNGINGIIKHRGLLWLATDDGVCRFDPDSVRRNRLPLPVEITDVAVNGESMRPASSYELPHDRNNVTINFVGIGFRTNGDIRYRYRLLGLGEDTTWHETVSRAIPFFSLPSGTYTFQVSAINEDGVWNPAPKEVRFDIAQHYAQTFWFRSGVILFGMLCLGFVVWRVADNRRRKYAIDAQISELRQQALSANMNPHFISNALSVVQDYVLRHDAYEANEFLARFSRLIRLNLETSLSSFVSLEEELERLGLYLSLEKLRFGENLDYRIVVDDAIDTDGTLVPSMLIQPYIENAIWHGILPAERPGLVEVSIRPLSDRTYTITIRDNGVGLTEGRKRRGLDRKSLSMELNRERLSLLSKSLKRSFSIVAYDATDNTGALCGTIVAITLPRDILVD